MSEMNDRQKAIKAWILERDEFTLYDLAKAVGGDIADPLFMMDWHAVQKTHLAGEATIKSGKGGKRYVVLRGEDAADVAIRQSQAALNKGLRAIVRGQHQAAMAPLMTNDEHKLAALKRREDRGDVMAQAVSTARRMRRFS